MKGKGAKNRNGQGCILLAASDNQELIAISALIEEMDIPLYLVKNVSEITKALERNTKMVGAIIGREFLGEDARAVFKKIKRMAPDLPIVLASSDNDAAFERSIRQMGVFYYLLAPYDREEFLNAVRALHSYGSTRR